MHFNGLTDKQVEESRKKYGSNVIPDSEPTTFWAEFKETFKDPMIRILLAIAALMIVMCVLGYAEIYEPIGTVVAVLIVAFVSAKTGVASDTKYRQLKDSTKKDQCKVYRNGLVTVIDVDDVVVGDKVLLQSGDKVPADGVLIHGTLRVDNSALNGEAEECPKTAADESFPLPEDITGDTFVDAHSLFRGAVLFDGEGVLDVRKVGLATMMGKMAEEMQDDEPDSPLKVKLGKLADMISRFGYIGAVVIAIMYFGYFILSAGGFAAYFSSGAPVIIQDIVEAVSLAVVIIVCAVPEGLQIPAAVQECAYRSLSQPDGCQLPLHKGAKGRGTDVPEKTITPPQTKQPSRIREGCFSLEILPQRSVHHRDGRCGGRGDGVRLQGVGRDGLQRQTAECRPVQ